MRTSALLGLVSLAMLSCGSPKVVVSPPGNMPGAPPVGMVVRKNTSFLKIHEGNIIVTNGAAFRLMGMVKGDIFVYSNSTVTVEGTLQGDVFSLGGTVEVKGVVRGGVYSNGVLW